MIYKKNIQQIFLSLTWLTDRPTTDKPGYGATIPERQKINRIFPRLAGDGHLLRYPRPELSKTLLLNSNRRKLQMGEAPWESFTWVSNDSNELVDDCNFIDVDNRGFPILRCWSDGSGPVAIERRLELISLICEAQNRSTARCLSCNLTTRFEERLIISQLVEM